MFFIMLGIMIISFAFTILTNEERTITMIKVEKTAKTLDEGIKNMMAVYKKRL